MQPTSLILHLVMEYLDTPELLRVCLVARRFHFPVIRHLYREITIISGVCVFYWDEEEEEKEEEKEEKETDIRSPNRATEVKESNIHKLVSAVRTNKQLVDVIQSMEIPRLMGDFWIFRLLKIIKPKSIICEEPMKIPVSTAGSVRRAKINVFSCSDYFSVLSDLTIMYDGQMENPGVFDLFASSLIKLEAYRNLESLGFQFRAIRDDRSWVEEEEYDFCPEWSVFFEIFTKQELKLELKTLKIEREAWEDVRKVAKIINSAIDVKKLNTLSLEITDNFFLDDSFKDLSPASIYIPFFEDLSSLQNLYIKHTYYKELDFETMETELRNRFPNQETQLRVHYIDSTSDYPLLQTLVTFEDYQRYETAVNSE